LYNNAFYAVIERKKQLRDGFEPVISVTVKGTDRGVSVAVRDNGTGIPQKIIDKIFQPFLRKTQPGRAPVSA